MTSKQVCSIVLLFCSLGVVVGNIATDADTTLTDIANYRQWTRVTEKPIPVLTYATGFD